MPKNKAFAQMTLFHVRKYICLYIMAYIMVYNGSLYSKYNYTLYVCLYDVYYLLLINVCDIHNHDGCSIS